MPVYYHSEDISFYPTEQDLYTRWIESVLTSYQSVSGNINIIFTSNAYLLQINQKYLKHNYFTDVITFDFCDKNLVTGDVFVSVEQVRNNSEELNVTFYNELCRVMIHGILHLLGFNDNSSKEKEEMRYREDEALRILEDIENERGI